MSYHWNALRWICLVGLAGCNGRGVAPDPSMGAVSFTYSGAVNGTFSAEGRFPLQIGSFEGQWTRGTLYLGDELVYVSANVQRSSATSDHILITIPRATPGTVSIPSCNPNICATIYVDIDGPFTLDTCALTSGSITLTEVEPRVKGTFSGTGNCAATSPTPGPFTVTDGKFDVGIRPQGWSG